MHRCQSIAIFGALLAASFLIASIDADISPELLRLLLTHPKSEDPCYDGYNKPRECKPDFENLAFNKEFLVSSKCDSNTKICKAKTINYKMNQTTCSKCTKSMQSIASLTDIDGMADAETCWVSDDQAKRKKSNVSLTLSFGKRYEITYITMKFCRGLLAAESFAIYKSDDFEQTWTPFQFYSTECDAFYGLSENAIVKFSDQSVALCDNPANKVQDHRISFSSLDKRPSAFNFELSQDLQEWVTATSIKIEFNRLPQQIEDVHDVSTVFALADVSIGGQCKCNGHASKCISNADNRLVCDCKHNTAGDECERCAPFHLDAPWRRATAKDANQCRPCDCNLHSNECEFNAELFELSGGKSGGVCKNCLHNTDGRYCEYCREGFYRDMTKPIQHRDACKECNCHRIGSLGKTCNQTSGQCPCKEGVTGLSCNKCAPGYQQSNSAVQPCVKTPSKSLMPFTIHAQSPQADTSSKSDSRIDTACTDQRTCNRQMRRVTAKKWCQSNFIIVATAINRIIDGKWWKYEVKVNQTLRTSPGLTVNDRITIVVPASTNDCNCPRIKYDFNYLLLGRWLEIDGKMSFVIDRSSVAAKWKSRYKRKINKLTKKEERGFCKKFQSSVVRPRQIRKTGSNNRSSLNKSAKSRKWWLQK